MAEENFEERDTAAARGRQCSRLVVVSSGASDEAGCPLRPAPPQNLVDAMDGLALAPRIATPAGTG